LSPSPKSGPRFDPENPADQDEIQCRGVQKIQGKGTLVLLHFEIVFVFRKILGHGDELVADLVPPVQHLFRWAARRGWRLILGLRRTVDIRSDSSQQGKNS